MNYTQAYQDNGVAIVNVNLAPTIIAAFDSDHQLVEYSEVYKVSAHPCTNYLWVELCLYCHVILEGRDNMA